MDPLPTLVADVKSALSTASPLNAGSLFKACIKVCIDSKALIGLAHEQKVSLLSKAVVAVLDEMKEKELALALALAGCPDDQKAAINDRYAHLTLIAESGLPSVLDTVYELFSGKLNVGSFISQVKKTPSSWLSWFSCIATSAVSVVAATGLVSEKQANDAAALVKKVEEAPKKVEEIADKVEAVVAQAKGAVPALAPLADAVGAVAEKIEASAVSLHEVAAVPVPEAVAPPAVPAEIAPSNPVETVPEENKQ